MQVTDAVIISMGVTLPFFIDPITNFARGKFFNPKSLTGVVIRGVALTTSTALTLYGITRAPVNIILDLWCIVLQLKGIEKNLISLTETKRESCSQLWLDRLPDLKKRIESLRIFSFSNSMDVSPYTKKLEIIEKLLIEPKKNREKIVALAKKLSTDLENLSLYQLANPLPLGNSCVLE